MTGKRTFFMKAALIIMLALLPNEWVKMDY
jgi:hypothetical protein